MTAMPVVRVVVAEAGEYVDDAAQIWAETTAARDGDADVAPLDLSRPIIEAVINSSDRSLLLIALGADSRALGFVAAEPTSDMGDRRAELRYLGVRPDAWGGGSALYRRLGWAAYGTPHPHPRSGRPEQTYTLSLEDELVDELLPPRNQRPPSAA